MNEKQLKTRIGLFLIISHFSIILLIVILYLLQGFLFEEMTTSIALIIPMFSIYTTAIIRNIVATKNQVKVGEDKKITKEFIFITYLVPSLFIFFLIALIFLKAFNVGFNTFEQFKIMLTISETAFGTYLGLVLSSLFEIKGREEISEQDSSQ